MLQRKPMTDVGKRIAAGMAMQGITSIQELARRVERTPSTVYRWLFDDVRSLDIMSVIRLSEVLRISLVWVFTGEGSPSPRESVTPDEAALLAIYRKLSAEAREELTDRARGLSTP